MPVSVTLLLFVSVWPTYTVGLIKFNITAALLSLPGSNLFIHQWHAKHSTETFTAGWEHSVSATEKIIPGHVTNTSVCLQDYDRNHGYDLDDALESHYNAQGVKSWLVCDYYTQTKRLNLPRVISSSAAA